MLPENEAEYAMAKLWRRPLIKKIAPTGIEAAEEKTKTTDGILALPEIADKGLDTLPLVFSHFPNVHAKTIQQSPVTWADVRAKLIAASREYPSKKACPLFKLATFGGVRTDKGSLRSDANLDKVYGVEGDYDGEKISVDQAGDLLARAGIEAFIYTSPSHSDSAPRWRVVAPLSRAHSKDERRAFVGVLNEALEGILNVESFTASQSFYYGRVNGAPFHYRHIVGSPLDAVALTMGERPPEKEAATRQVRNLEDKDIERQFTLETITQDTIQTLHEAISALNPQRAAVRESWIKIGHAIKSLEQGGFDEKALDMWLQFSALDPDAYDEEDALRRWEGFIPNDITYKTIFKLADEDSPGWRGAPAAIVGEVITLDANEPMPPTSSAPVDEAAHAPAPFRGVMAEVVDAVLRVAPKPQPELTTLAVLIGMAAAIPGNYKLPSGMRLNLYGCGIVSTGEGKERPYAIAEDLVSKADGIVIGKPASGEGLEDALEPKAGTIVMLDEIAHFFAAMNGAKVPPHLHSLAALLLTLFSASSRVHHTRKKAATSSTKQSRAIANPVVSLLGTSTPEKLGMAMGVGNIEDGLLGRFLFAKGRSDVDQRRTREDCVMPEIVGTKALALANPSMYADENGLVTIAEPRAVDCHLVDVMHRITQRRKVSTSPFARALLARSFEKLERVAGVLAVWDAPDKPVMTVEHVAWAESFIAASDATLIQFTADYMHGGQVQADASSVLRTIDKILSKEINPQRANDARFIKEGCAPWSMVLRASKLDKKRMDDAVNHLIDLGDVSKVAGKVKQANGGERTVFLLRREAADE